MATFTDISNFWGTYEGRHDGRRARLVISDTKADSWNPIFSITLEDLDRGVTFRSLHTQENPPPERAHILTNVRLPQVGGGGEKHYTLLLLHTWDIDYLTGVSVWEGREFGSIFQRVE